MPTGEMALPLRQPETSQRDDGTGAHDWVDRIAQLLLLRRIPGTLGAIDHANAILQLHQGQRGKARHLLDAAARLLGATTTLLGGHSSDHRPGILCVEVTPAR